MEEDGAPYYKPRTYDSRLTTAGMNQSNANRFNDTERMRTSLKKLNYQPDKKLQMELAN